MKTFTQTIAFEFGQECYLANRIPQLAVRQLGLSSRQTIEFMNGYECERLDALDATGKGAIR